MRESESSRSRWGLPASALMLAFTLAPAAPAAGQVTYRLSQNENFRQQASGNSARLGAIQAGVLVDGVSAQGQWIQIDVAGWIWSRSVGRINDATYDIRVTAGGGENLRDEPNGQVLGRLANGTYLQEISRNGNWIQVHRIGWMFGASLDTVAPPVTVGEEGGTVGAPDASLDAAVLQGQSAVRDAPDGSQRAVAAGPIPVRIMSRSGDWVRVQLEGWVRESDLSSAEDDVLVGVTGAEVRTNPDIYTGKLVQWKLQFISIQEADELRRDLPTGQPYILARGPVPEPGFVYAIIDQSRAAALEDLPALSEIVVIGRVRRGRSEQLGNPIIEVVDLAPVEQ